MQLSKQLVEVKGELTGDDNNELIKGGANSISVEWNYLFLHAIFPILSYTHFQLCSNKPVTASKPCSYSIR